MHDLEITWSGGQLRFGPDESPVLIGRSSKSSVVVPQGTVSRRHLIMTWNGRSWQAEDVSTHGTFDPIGVRLAATWTVGTNLVVRLGSPRGAEISMRLITTALDEAAAVDPFADPDAPPTVVDFGPPPRPDGAERSPGHDDAEPVEGVDTPDGDSPGVEAPDRPEHSPDLDRLAPVGHLDPNDRYSDNRYSDDRADGVDEQVVDLRDPVSMAGSATGEAIQSVDIQPLESPFEPADDPSPGLVVAGSDLRGGRAAVADPLDHTQIAGRVDHDLDRPGHDDIGSDHQVDAGELAPAHHLAPDIHDDVDQGPDHNGAGSAGPIGGGVDHATPSGPWDRPPSPGLGPIDHVDHLDPGNGRTAQSPSEAIDGPYHDPAATFVENDTLRLQVDGEDFVFLPGHEITVGRDPRCTVVVDERHSLVSRRHLRFVHAEGSWWLEDASSKGTYVDGRRLNRPYRAEGAFIAGLGDSSAGTQLRVVTSGEHRQPTNRAGLAIAATAAAALVLAAIVAWFAFGGNDDGAEVLSAAKKSTVMLLSESGHGSGFFVSDSLIVTNQHVAAMADQLVVAVSPEEDEPAEISYVASLVENHPFLDVAVVEITNRAEINDEGTVTIGDPVDSADVPPLPLGDSSAVTIGDAVTSTGFPGRFSVSSSDDNGQLRLAAVSITQGQAVNFTSWPGCSAPDLASFIPDDAPPTVTCSADGTIDKGVLLASFASGEGASGSAVIHDDSVVAVVFAGDSEDATASRSIATSAFSGWLDGVIANR